MDALALAPWATRKDTFYKDSTNCSLSEVHSSIYRPRVCLMTLRKTETRTVTLRFPQGDSQLGLVTRQGPML
jgi:hypothetical protein